MKEKKNNMGMGKTNYRIVYSPKQIIGGYGFHVYLTPEFCDFARQQEVDKERYERRGLEFLKASYFKEDISGLWPEGRRICNWDGGLLTNISAPGNGCGLDLLLDDPHGPALYPNNIDSLYQQSALLAIVSNWLNDMELKILSVK